MAMTNRRSRPGRPRHVPDAGTASPREQILDASSKLFVEKGFAATSTREIAEMVGIRQASLYYHFSGKDEILQELLKRSVRPSLDKVEKIRALIPPDSYETGLFLLALIDVRTLAEVDHNIGMLYQLPDVACSEAYEEFRGDRHELLAAYGAFGVEVAKQRGMVAFAEELGQMLIQLVEVVISVRANGQSVDCARADRIASSCLRICGASEEQIEAAKPRALELLPTFLDEKIAINA